jgi:site-specific DNA-cytosine methylase
VQSLVWNAADEGLPIRRERRYTICIRKGSFGIPLLRFNSSVWSSLVFCSRVATGDIFLHASDEHLSHLRQDLCFRKGFPPVRVRSNGADGVWAWEVLMSKSERDVLLSLRQKAEVFKAEHPDIDISKHKWLVNVTQSEKVTMPQFPVGFGSSSSAQQQVLPGLPGSKKISLCPSA